MNARGLWVIVLVVGCKSSAVERAEKVAAGKTFWPEAPAVTSKSGTRALAYKPESIAGYTLTAEGGTPAGSQLHVEFKMTLGLAFGAGATARERDARMTRLDLVAKGEGMNMTMKLDHDGLMVDDGTGSPATFKRGDGGAIDVAGMTDQPFTTLVFGDDNTVKVRTKPDHPFTRLGGAGDMLDDALVLFPDLPKQAVAPGYKWSVTRDTKIGGTGSRALIKYDFEYLGDGGCPSGAKSCAQLALTASSNDADVTSEGISAKAKYGMAGKVFLDTERGAVDESRVHMDMDLEASGQKVEMGATYVVKPST